MHKILKWKVEGSERIMNGIWSCSCGKGRSEGRHFHGVVLVGTCDPWPILIYLYSDNINKLFQYHQHVRK